MMAGPSLTGLMSAFAVTGGALFGIIYNMENNRRANYAILNEKLLKLDEQTSGEDAKLSSLELARSLQTLATSLEGTRQKCGPLGMGCTVSAHQYELLGAHFDMLRCVRLYYVLQDELGEETAGEYRAQWDTSTQLNAIADDLSSVRVPCEELLRTSADYEVALAEDGTVGDDGSMTADTIPPSDATASPSGTSEPAAGERLRQSPPPRRLIMYVQYTSTPDDKDIVLKATSVIDTSSSISAYGADYVDTNLRNFELRYLKAADKEDAGKWAERIGTKFPGCGKPVVQDLSARYETDPRVKPGTLELWFPSEISEACRGSINSAQ